MVNTAQVFCFFDTQKALANLQKHRVSFAEVEPVFYDNFALASEDRDVKGRGDRSSFVAPENIRLAESGRIR